MPSTHNKNQKVNRYNVRRLRISEAKNLTCKRFPGKIIIRKSDKYMLDQLSDSDNIWVYNKDKYLMNTYGITTREYYCIVKYGSYFHIPVCRYCGKDNGFRSVNDGFYPICTNKSCSNSLKSDNKFLRSDRMRLIASKNLRKYNINKWKLLSNEDRSKTNKSIKLNNPEYKNTLHLSNTPRKRELYSNSKKLSKNLLYKIIPELKDNGHLISNWNYKLVSYGQMKAFNSKGSDKDLCEFYIAKSLSNKFKFGISINSGKRSYKNYIKYKVILKGDRLFISKLELLIKFKMKIFKEYLSWNRVGEFRECFRNYYNLLTKFNQFSKKF
jgi:hypothetical protein